jgi:CheY-like chemotaxis protein
MSDMQKQNGLNPKTKEPAARRPAHAAPPEVTVLHIDDDPNDTELLRAATRKAGTCFNLQNVEDGEMAIAYLSGADIYADRRLYPLPSLILLDLKMPRTTGLEMLAWIRKHPELSRLPVVVLSGSELHEDIRQAYAIGANSYLVKPLGFEALVDLVKDVNAVWLSQQQQSSIQSLAT